MLKTSIELIINSILMLVLGYLIIDNVNTILYTSLLLVMLSISIYALSLLNIRYYVKRLNKEHLNELELKLKHLNYYNKRVYLHLCISSYISFFLIFSKTIHNNTFFMKESSFTELFNTELFFQELFYNTNFLYILSVNFVFYLPISLNLSSKNFFIRFISE